MFMFYISFAAFFISLYGDRACLHGGEVWQYMGSKTEGSKLIHTFRHRCHPSDSQQHYRHITTSLLGEEVTP